MDVINKKCRACLNIGDGVEICDNMKTIFEELIGALIQPSDNITKFLCLKCQTNLLNFQEFKKVCLDSDWVLKNEQSIKIECSSSSSVDVNVKIEKGHGMTHIEEDFSKSVESKAELVIVESPAKKKPISESDSRLSNKQKKIERPRIQCSKCTKFFHKDHRLTAHILRIHENKRAPEICTVCNKGMADLSSLRRHMRSHAGDRKYICQHCNKGFLHPDALKLHERTHSEERNYICDICGMAFKNPANLRTHKSNRHIEDRPYSCNICNKSFKMKCAYNEHRRAVHTDEKNFVCHQCDGAYKSKKALARHIVSVHCEERNYPCNSCGKKFKTHMQWKIHIRQHTGERPHLCTYEECTMAFAAKAVLKKHIMVHTGERPAKCQLCTKGFYQQSDLDRHMKVHNKT